MVEIAVLVLPSTLTVVLGGVSGLILAHLRSKTALDACLKAKKACNDEVHCLRDRISDLEVALLTAQGRIVGLEREFDDRLKVVETKDVS